MSRKNSKEIQTNIFEGKETGKKTKGQPRAAFLKNIEMEVELPMNSK